jgi:predicted permease
MTARERWAGPRGIAPRLLRWIVPRGLAEEIEGDLAELWQQRADAGRRGLRRALLADLGSIWMARARARWAGRVGSARPVHRLRGVFEMRHDLIYALRLMRRRPGFAALIVATLALGTGSATAIFTLCDRVLLRPLPYPDPDRLVRLEGAPFTFAGGHMQLSRSLGDIKALAAAGMYATGGVNFGDASGADRLRAAAASASFFDVLGVRPHLGRVYTAEEDRDAATVAVISHRVWTGRLARRADIPGAVVRLNGAAFTIVGVMPDTFGFPDRTDVWVPPFSAPQLTGQAFAPDVVGRIAAGVSLAQARAEFDAFTAARRPRQADRDPLQAVPLHADVTASVRSTLIFLACGVGLLLLATCSNVAGLFMSRLTIRSRELAMRRVLGAPRWRLVRQVLLEALMLAAAGGAAGLGLAVWALQAFAAAPLPSLHGPAAPLLDARMATIGVGVTAIAVMFFGLAPALTTGAGGGLAAAREGRATTRPGRRLRRMLVAAQVAAALVLLSGAAGTLVASWRLNRIDVGFGRPRALAVELTLPEVRYGEPSQFAEFFTRLEAGLRAVPGVARAAATSFVPGTSMIGVALPVRDALAPARAEGESPFSATLVSVSADYFAAMGMRVRQGRPFTSADRAGAPPVIVLSEAAAARVFPGVANPVGRRVTVGLHSADGPLEVVGVVNDVRFRGPAANARPAMYLSILQRPPYGPVSIVVDTDGSSPIPVEAIRQVVATLDNDLPLYNVQTVAALRGAFLARERLVLALSTGFASMTLALVVIGLYGVMSQLVAQRTREIGIAMALGADGRRVSAGVIRGAEWVIGAGCALGLVGVFWVSRVGEGLVPGFTPPGAPVVAGLIVLLAGVGALAAWLPARRAATVDPVVALRAE